MVTILEHLLSDERKTRKLVEVLEAFGLRIEFTSDRNWFHIVKK